MALLEEVHSKIPAVATQDYVEDLAQRVEHKVASVAAEHECDAADLKVRAQGLFEDHGGCVEQQAPDRDYREAQGERTTVRNRNVGAQLRSRQCRRVQREEDWHPETEGRETGEEIEKDEEACSVEHRGQSALQYQCLAHRG